MGLVVNHLCSACCFDADIGANSFNSYGLMGVMETLYQILLTAIITLVGLVLWACASVFNKFYLRWFFQALAILLAIVLIVKYVWTGFTPQEIALFVFRNVLGWGILLGLIYLAVSLSLSYDRYKKALKDVEDLKEQNLGKEKAILDLEKSVEKLGAPVPKRRIRVF